MSTEYESLDALALAALVRRSEVSAAELAQMAITRIEQYDNHLNSVVCRFFDQALDYARSDIPDGPFRGVPFLLKDLTAELAGVPLTGASRFFEKYVPARDSQLVRLFKQAGFVILGKTNTPELGLAPFTEPELFGATHNPWDRTRSPGGSSGGSAAAVAARLVPAAHGNDGGGSIRIPASCCGLFGLKPTRGRTPDPPTRDPAFGFSVDHALTRSVRDSAAILDAINVRSGAHSLPVPRDGFLDSVGHSPAPLRIGFTSQPLLGGALDPDCRAALERTVQLLGEMGHHLEEDAPLLDARGFRVAFVMTLSSELRSNLDQAATLIGLPLSPKDFETSTWLLAELGRTLTADQRMDAHRMLQEQARLVARFFDQYDLLLTPTLARVPVKTGSLQPNLSEKTAAVILGRLRAARWLTRLDGIAALARKVFDFTPFTPLFNVTGQPAMSVPLFWNDHGLPIGVQLAARFGDEATLFQLAGQLEKARPWSDRRPPLLNEGMKSTTGS